MIDFFSICLANVPAITGLRWRQTPPSEDHIRDDAENNVSKAPTSVLHV